ncbi:hypothetical protein [Xanthomonas theicola]|uniref:hypothetical protein n=1 Tax=Xanthomonas theicola TaxID=56464 RepID=UPI001304EC82|nr:hypothetical protein [Xanthomonas theicola]
MISNTVTTERSGLRQHVNRVVVAGPKQWIAALRFFLAQSNNDRRKSHHARFADVASQSSVFEFIHGTEE